MQLYHYIESAVPVRDRTTLYRGVRRRTATSERTHEECSRTPNIARFTSVRIRTTVSHGVRGRTARRSACGYEFVPLELQMLARIAIYLYTELQCKIATATQYHFARTHYVHICGIIARLEVSRGQILYTGFYFFPVWFYISRRYHEWVDYSLTTRYGVCSTCVYTS